MFALDSDSIHPAEYRFEAFCLNLRTAELTKLGMRIRLQGQPLQILIMLLEQSGQVVTRDCMKERLWPADTFVDFEHSLNTAIKKLRQTLGDSATEPRYIETLPRIGYRFLPRVEGVPEPTAARSAILNSQASALETPSQPVRNAVAGDRFRIARFLRYALLPLLLAGAALVLNFGNIRGHLRALLRAPVRSSDAVIASAKPRNSVAILGFKNLSGRPEEEWLSTAFSEMLATELGAGGKLRVIPGENIARMKSELALPEAASYTRESLQRIRGNLGTDMVVLGSYTALGEKSGGQIRLDLRLQDAATGETSAVLSTTGTEARLFELVSQAGEQLREKAGIGTIPLADSAMLQAALPDSPQGAQLYAQGLERLRAYDSLSARPLLERAIQANPKFALAHSALSIVWTNLGYQLKAREEAKRAFDLSSSLSREQQLFMEGRYRTATNDWKKAIDVYQTLFAMYPDNLEYGLQLTNAQVFSRKAKEALTTLESFRKLPLSPAYVPRVDLALAFAKEAVSDLNGAIESARSAEAESRAIGAKELEARAWHVEASALMHSGQPEKSLAAFEQAGQLFQSSGNKGSVARVLCDQALLKQDRGDIQGARTMFEDSLAVFRSIGDQSSAAAAMADVASVLKSEGDLAAAKKMFLESLAVSREIGSRQSTTRFELASVLFDEGNLAQAQTEFSDLLAASLSAGEKFGTALSQAELASVLNARGRLGEARKLYEDSLATTRGMGDEEDTAITLSSFAILQMELDDLPAAHRSAQEAADTAQKLNEKADLAEARAVLASVLLEEGDAPQSELAARQSSEAFAAEKASLKQADSDSMLALALLAQNKIDEAQRVSARASAVASRSQFLRNRLSIGIRVARVQAGAGHSQEALQKLSGVLAEAKSSGQVPQELEAQLAMSEIELKTGKSSKTRAQLAALKREATSRGFLLVARKSDEAAAKRN